MPLHQAVTQSHAEDLRDLLHGMPPGPRTSCLLYLFVKRHASHPFFTNLAMLLY